MQIGEFETAIFHYKKALNIDPFHSTSSKTNFFLAECELKIGEYSDALKNIELFIRDENSVEEWMLKAREMRANAQFGVQAINNPKSFNPINIGPGINSNHAEYFPCLTVDGKTMLFTRYLPIKMKVYLRRTSLYLKVMKIKIGGGRTNAKKCKYYK